MTQFRKAITVINKCSDCPCYTSLWWGDPEKLWGCNHTTVKNVYKRIVEYYPKTYTVEMEGNMALNNSEPPAIAFSENDLKEIETDGFPYWCPLDRSK